MPIKKDRQRVFGKSICLAIVQITLFAPVLQLFMQLNDLTSSRALLFYLPFVQLTFILLRKWYLRLPIQLIASAYIVYAYFPLQQIFGRTWLQLFWNELKEPLSHFMSEEATIMPNMLSLFLFIAIIFISSWFLLSFFNPYISFFSSLGYLLILQVFTTTELFQTTVSTLLFGLLLIGVTKIPITGTLKNSTLSLLLLMGAGFFLVRAAIWGVRHLAEQQAWTITQADDYHEALENKGFFKWIENHSPGGASVRSGFSENDSQLGGPLTQRFNTVFLAHTSRPQYWFIEAKEIYSGRGWETSNERAVDIDLAVYEAFDAEASNIETETIQLELSESFDYIPYPYQTIAFDFLEQAESIHLQLELPSEQYLVADENNSIQNYTITKSLNEVDLENTQDNFTADDMNVETYNQYTQLPEELPQRVIDLAHNITEGLSSQYEKVRAIEQYLKQEGGFQYSVSQTPFVPTERDYVDHFLFDSKIGYCDNFSTAMVVLCRSLDIPTRWAKGFNTGEKINQDGEAYYEITNANAHSWPEVYFGEAGWIPFEPTPPFNQPLTADTALEEDRADTMTPKEESQSTPSTSSEIAEEAESSQEEVIEDDESFQPENVSWFNRQTGWLLAVLSFGGLLIFSILKRWSLVIWAIKKISLTTTLTIEQKTAVINQLFKWKQKPQPSQTMRQYFEQWISAVPQKKAAIQAYVQLLEEIHYAPERIEGNSHKEVLLEMIQVFETAQQEKRKKS